MRVVAFLYTVALLCIVLRVAPNGAARVFLNAHLNNSEHISARLRRCTILLRFSVLLTRRPEWCNAHVHSAEHICAIFGVAAYRCASLYCFTHRTEWSRACLYSFTRICIAKSTLAPFAALLCPAPLLIRSKKHSKKISLGLPCTLS